MDTIGVGAGVYDRLREKGHPVYQFIASARPTDAVQFANLRAEAYWRLREDFEQGVIDLDPRDDELAAQLGKIKFKINSRGQTLIESKPESRARRLPSPDRADAAVWRDTAPVGRRPRP